MRVTDLIECDWEYGVPAALRCGGMRGTGFGIETADRHSFFTLAPERHGARIIEDRALRNGPEAGERHLTVAMAEGRWSAVITSQLHERGLTLGASLTTLSPSFFQDFVVRAVFSAGSFTSASISGEHFEHTGSNIYHQHPVRQAALSGPAGAVEIRVSDTVAGPAFQQVLYVRDAPEGWVVHARLIPKPPYALLWVRWFNRVARLSLPDWASRALLSVPGLKSRLWYAAERGGRDALQLQASGLAHLNSEERIALSMEMTFERS
tara:strand:- start:14282 stop:15076 length:795 start_codon:yes stop_codon:yes gene_type:complete